MVHNDYYYKMNYVDDGEVIWSMKYAVITKNYEVWCKMHDAWIGYWVTWNLELFPISYEDDINYAIFFRMYEVRSTYEVLIIHITY